MVNKVATFEYSRRSEPYYKSPQLPPIQTKRSHRVKNYDNPTPKLEFRIHQPQKVRSRKRIVNYKPLAVLAPSFVLGLLILKLCLSFLPISFKASAPEQFKNQPQKVAVLRSQPPNNTTTSPVIALGHAIVGKESSADSQSLNPHSGALGLAQIMPVNLSEWSQEILGYRLTPDEFLNSPQLQMKIIEYKLSEYWQEALVDSSGDEETAVLRVASYWYSGNPDLYTSTVSQSYKGTDGQVHRYPSVAKYSSSILQKYRQYREGET